MIRNEIAEHCRRTHENERGPVVLYLIESHPWTVNQVDMKL